jgi:hypothetical protein
MTFKDKSMQKRYIEDYTEGVLENLGWDADMIDKDYSKAKDIVEQVLHLEECRVQQAIESIESDMSYTASLLAFKKLRNILGIAEK